jgi:cytochrome b561
MTIDASDRYNLTAILLHWIIAIAVIFMLGLGLYMSELPRGSAEQLQYYQLHKSVGITILVLSALRILWRFTHEVPPLPSSLKPWERITSHGIQHIFYLLIVILPLSGWAIVSASTRGVPTRLFGLVTLPNISFIADLENKKAVGDIFGEAHELMAWAMIALLVLHVGAALRHHFMLKDNVLRRMLP